MLFADPGNNVAVIETDDQFHLHPYVPAEALDDPDDVRIFPTRRHEIDQANGAHRRFHFRFENQSVTAITAASRCDFSVGDKSPPAVFSIAQQGREAGARIESGKAKPVHGTLAA